MVQEGPGGQPLIVARASQTGESGFDLIAAAEIAPLIWERLAAAVRHVGGRPAGWENACLALGPGHKGMLLSAGIGLAVAELLVRGDTTMPIGACAPERWAAPAPR